MPASAIVSRTDATIPTGEPLVLPNMFTATASHFVSFSIRTQDARPVKKHEKYYCPSFFSLAPGKPKGALVLPGKQCHLSGESATYEQLRMPRSRCSLSPHQKTGRLHAALFGSRCMQRGFPL